MITVLFEMELFIWSYCISKLVNLKSVEKEKALGYKTDSQKVWTLFSALP